jgi:hypothetical protein
MDSCGIILSSLYLNLVSPKKIPLNPPLEKGEIRGQENFPSLEKEGSGEILD